MKRLIVFLTAMWVISGWASVSEVREFAPAAGRDAEVYQAGVEARAIHEKLGATVFIGTDQMGHMHYVLTFPDWGAWAKFGTAMQSSKEWAAFGAKYFVANPASTQVAVLFLETPVVAKTLPVTLVYVWKPLPGKREAFLAIAQQAVTIQNALGASAGINIDDVGNVYYEIAFDSWASWAKFVAAVEKSTEWTALLKKANEVPSAKAMRVLRIEQYTAP